MFVYIIGNPEQNIFKLGIASDPFLELSSLQAGNPYKLSILCKICVSSRNEASLVEQLGRKELSQYESEGEWHANVPKALSNQFASDYYLLRLATRVGAKLSDRRQQAMPRGRTNLQRLTPLVSHNGLTFEDVLKKVEQAYDEGIAIDNFFSKLN